MKTEQQSKAICKLHTYERIFNSSEQGSIVLKRAFEEIDIFYFYKLDACRYILHEIDKYFDIKSIYLKQVIKLTSCGSGAEIDCRKIKSLKTIDTMLKTGKVPSVNQIQIDVCI
jgi:hypothetical protein